MDASTTKVVSIVGRWSGRRHDRHKGQNGRRDPSDDGGLAVQLQVQNSTLHRAITEIELAKDSVDISAAGATDALRRFEQTLSNLRLSLSNQRAISAAIETAAEAGEAAARVKALMLDVEFDRKSVLGHDFSGEVLLRAFAKSQDPLLSTDH